MLFLTHRFFSWLPRSLLPMHSTMPEPSFSYVRQVLAQIEQEYDFSQFTMDSFCQWIEQRYNRHIQVCDFPMPAEMFGCWVNMAERDFIFYERNTAPLHQAHIQLHELAHILCGHQTFEPTEESGLTLTMLINDLLHAAFPSATPALASILARSSHSSQDEIEAEALSDLIQQRVHEHQRSRELAQPITFSRRPFVQDAYQIMEWI